VSTPRRSPHQKEPIKVENMFSTERQFCPAIDFENKPSNYSMKTMNLKFTGRFLLLEGVPKVFANGSNEVSYADTSGVSCWWG
jgi:hypothetical protein